MWNEGDADFLVKEQVRLMLLVLAQRVKLRQALCCSHHCVQCQGEQEKTAMYGAFMHLFSDDFFFLNLNSPVAYFSCIGSDGSESYQNIGVFLLLTLQLLTAVNSCLYKIHLQIVK